jgi:hypothetical protein
MNVEIETEAAQFLWECIYGIFVAVCEEEYFFLKKFELLDGVYTENMLTNLVQNMGLAFPGPLYCIRKFSLNFIGVRI